MKKWGAYPSEDKHFTFARLGWTKDDERTQCPEAQIMDIADDVTYAIHDVEDFFRAGLIPLDRLARSTRRAKGRKTNELESFLDGALARRKQEGKQEFTDSDLREAFKALMGVAPFDGPYTASRVQRADLHNWSSVLITQYLGSVSPSPNRKPGEPFLVVDEKMLMEIAMLKELTWLYVILNPGLATQQIGQRRIVRTLFRETLREIKHRNVALLPLPFREELEGGEDSRRVVSDYIASLTEHEAIQSYCRLTGISTTAVFNPIAR